MRHGASNYARISADGPRMPTLAGGSRGELKAGACSIRFEGAPREGAGRLGWFLPPKILRYAATRKRRA